MSEVFRPKLRDLAKLLVNEFELPRRCFALSLEPADFFTELIVALSQLRLLPLAARTPALK